MKPHASQQLVESQRLSRTVGDEPSLGRLAHMPGPRRSKSSRRDKAGGNKRRRYRDRILRRRVIMMWSSVLAVVSLVVIGVMAWLGLAPNEDSPEMARAGHAVALVVDNKVPRIESPTKAVAVELVKRALLIRDPDKVAEFFRVGSASPETVVAWLRDKDATDGAITEYEWLSSIDSNGLPIDLVVVKAKEADEWHHRLALLTPDDNGRWQIDFDAFARTVKPAWSELLDGSASQGMVRALLKADNYYNGVYVDEKQWVCYNISSPDITVDFTGYCRKDSPQDTAMKLITSPISNHSTKKLTDKYRATIEIRRNEGADARQFEITRVLADDWVMSNKPFDETCK